MTYSPGLKDIVAAETRLSGVDGEAGKLTIAGFPLEEIAERAAYEEMVHLLWHGTLPTAAFLDRFSGELAAYRPISGAILDSLGSAAKERRPVIDTVRMAVASLPTRDDATDARTLVAGLPSIVAAYWRLLHGEEPVEPHPGLDHVANLLYMLTGEILVDNVHGDADGNSGDGGRGDRRGDDGGSGDRRSGDRRDADGGSGDRSGSANGMGRSGGRNGDHVRALTTYLNTVIDHGMNASTFTARVIVSTRSDFISAVTGAIGALKGPLHGGAPGPVLAMLEAIGDAGNAEPHLRRKLETGELLMGFGHAVYRVRDPRADVLSRAASSFFAEDDALYALALHVEKTAIELLEEYKPGRRLHTNVEFYTALLLNGLGLHPDLFTPMFAVGRVGGWVAHCFEQRAVDRLYRPESVYTGDDTGQWIPVNER